MSILARDQSLPADIRIAVARKVHRQKPRVGDRSGGDTDAFARLDLLLSIVPNATQADRRKAASGIAEFFLPKILGRRKKGSKFPPDEFGFSVDPKLAREFRDTVWEIACLRVARKKLAANALARKVTKLHNRLDEIRQSLQCPCPSKYGDRQFKLDEARLENLHERRARNVIFSPEEDTEEAHRMVRAESFRGGPQESAKGRLEELRQKKRAFDNGSGVPLTAREVVNYKLLFLLYRSDPPLNPSDEFLDTHPFKTDWAYKWVVGNPNYPEYFTG